jgi:hypothetical protein
MKNHKTAINSTTMADGIKISTDLASLDVVSVAKF